MKPMKIPYPVARILVSIAESQAVLMNVPMAIAVVDKNGGLIIFARMDETLPASTELAVSKAYTAAVLRMATHEVGKLAQPGEALYGIQHTHSGQIVLFGGGLPLYLQGNIVGAIGISGGSVDEDVAVAQYAVNAMEEIEYWSRRIKTALPAKPPEELWRSNLEPILRETLEHMNYDLPAEANAVLAGAILLACSERR
jgi:uncharacterized protein GlcG (DUF336 family)